MPADMHCFHCDSAAVEMRSKKAPNGATMIAYQCMNCGHKVDNWIAHKDITVPFDAIPAWEPEKPERRHTSNTLRLPERKVQTAAMRDRFDAQWLADFDAYQKTPRWASLQASVIQRAAGVCEGCGQEPATHAHHTSYRNVQHEFLWELVAICDACLDRINRPSPAEAAK